MGVPVYYCRGEFNILTDTTGIWGTTLEELNAENMIAPFRTDVSAGVMLTA
jgi:hypothetical protein